MDIDAQVLQEFDQLARQQGQPLSLVVEQALRDSLRSRPPVELYGEPLTDEDIEQSARVTFRALDEEEKGAGSR
jgi:hypothetical protein